MKIPDSLYNIHSFSVKAELRPSTSLNSPYQIIYIFSKSHIFLAVYPSSVAFFILNMSFRLVWQNLTTSLGLEALGIIEVQAILYLSIVKELCLKQ